MQESFPGFLLTSHYEDSPYCQLHFWIKTDLGPKEIIIDHKPVLFVGQKAKVDNEILSQCERKELNLLGMDNEPLAGLYFSRARDYFEAKEKLPEKGIRTYESDVRFDERFLMERFIKGGVEVFANADSTQIKNPQIKSFEVANIPFEILSLDIETGIKGDLYSIAFHQLNHLSGEEKKKVFMLGELENEGEVEFFSDEKEILKQTEKLIEKWDPDFLIGWNVVGFDLRFLEKKAFQCGVELNWARDKSRLRIDERGPNVYAKIKGRVVLDGPLVLKRAFYKFENFKLETVASELLGQGKDIASDAGKVAEIERRFKEDKMSLAFYNLMDSELVSRIFHKTSMIEFLKSSVETTGLLFDRQGISTAAFDFLYLPQIHRRGRVASNIVDVARSEGASGGFVFEPQGGLHQGVIVLDFKSLYPTLMRSFFIGPFSRFMAARDDVSPDEIVNTPAGVNYSRNFHILPQILKNLMNERQLAKEKGNPHLAQALKITMNSFYGVLGAAHCRFYSPELPRSITETGQYLLKKVADFFSSEGLEIIYGDTDSVFLKLKKEHRAKPFEKLRELENKGNEFLKEHLADKFQVESFLTLEGEKVFKKLFLPPARSGSSAKKRYVGVLESERGEEALHFSGMEAVRSDWTPLARKFQRK